MPLPNLLADECVHDALVRWLRAPCGYIVRRVKDFSASKYGDGIEDHAILFDLAVREGLAVITLNEADFVNLHKSNQDHKGILIIEEEADMLVQARRIDDALKRDAELQRDGNLHGRLKYLTRAATIIPKPKGRRARGGNTAWRKSP
jgi:hypothetical protein